MLFHKISKDGYFWPKRGFIYEQGAGIHFVWFFIGFNFRHFEVDFGRSKKYLLPIYLLKVSFLFEWPVFFKIYTNTEPFYDSEIWSH